MSANNRPNGLTILAICNFLFAAISAFGILNIIILFFHHSIKTSNSPQYELVKTVGPPMAITLFSILVILIILLSISGIGFLKRKRFIGRTLGNAYAILAIFDIILTGLMLDNKLGGGAIIGTITGVIYPIVLLFLLNTYFKKDFAN